MTIAADAITGSLGTAVDMPSSEEAERTAMSSCESKGGSTNCKIYVTYRNGCGAMVAGDKAFNVRGAPTLLEATDTAMKTCKGGTTNCRVYYSACSLPVRIK